MEDDLILQAQLGNTEAFRRLVVMHGDIAWRTARVLLRDAGRAEDAVQEAWLDAWRGLAGFQIHRAFRPWLLTLVANRCRMALRRRTLTTVPITRDIGEGLCGADDVVDAALRRETDAVLRDALATLPAEQAHVLELRFYADLELTEIAGISGVPLGTVKSRLHRALTSLRASLQQPAATTPDGDHR